MELVSLCGRNSSVYQVAVVSDLANDLPAALKGDPLYSGSGDESMALFFGSIDPDPVFCEGNGINAFPKKEVCRASKVVPSSSDGAKIADSVSAHGIADADAISVASADCFADAFASDTEGCFVGLVRSEMDIRNNSSYFGHVGVGMEFPPIPTGSGLGYVSSEILAHDSRVASSTNTDAISDVDGILMSPEVLSRSRIGDLTMPTKSPGDLLRLATKSPEVLATPKTTTGESGLFSHGSAGDLSVPSGGYWEMGKVFGYGNTANADATIDVAVNTYSSVYASRVRRNMKSGSRHRHSDCPCSPEYGIWLLMALEIVNGFGKRFPHLHVLVDFESAACSDRARSDPVVQFFDIKNSSPVVLCEGKSMCDLRAVSATTGYDIIAAADLHCLVSGSGKGTLITNSCGFGSHVVRRVCFGFPMDGGQDLHEHIGRCAAGKGVVVGVNREVGSDVDAQAMPKTKTAGGIGLPNFKVARNMELVPSLETLTMKKIQMRWFSVSEMFATGGCFFL